MAILAKLLIDGRLQPFKVRAPIWNGSQLLSGFIHGLLVLLSGETAVLPTSARQVGFPEVSRNDDVTV